MTKVNVDSFCYHDICAVLRQPMYLGPKYEVSDTLELMCEYYEVHVELWQYLQDVKHRPLVVLPFYVYEVPIVIIKNTI